jgi:hypothetical protein
MGITITKLLGGIGNQLFQYAMGRAVSLRNKTELILDLSGFEHYKLRSYSLSAFALAQRFPSPREVAIIASSKKGIPPPKRSLLDLFSRTPRSLQIIAEKSFSVFQPEALSAPANVYLDGYWQFPAYFEHIEDILRTDFRFIRPLHRGNKEILAQIRETEAVSVHVRRGDRVTDPEANQLHGTCEPSFYHQAISRICDECANPHFYFFSDEPDWARNNLRLPARHTIVQSPLGTPDFEELMLMSSCRHHIFGNSTYSWWGAWLNPRRDKIVITPKKWFRSIPEPPGLFPSGWIRI